MVTTWRGWPALGPALLAFTVVVCGSVSLPANSHASVFDCSHQYVSTGSTHWTAPATDHDSLDSCDDGDEVVDAFVAAPIIQTSDDGVGRVLPQTESGAVSPPRSARLALRGPPEPTFPAYTQNDSGREQDSDVIVDDDDQDDDDDYDDDDSRDDGGAADRGGSARAVTRRSSSSLIAPQFHALVSIASNDHSLRAPPL